jgi:hypothetical protein
MFARVGRPGRPARQAIVGTKVSAGIKEDGFRKGVTLYRVVWKDYSAAATTWEPAENIHDEIIADYEAGIEAEAQLDAEEAAALEGDDDMDEE